MKRHPALVALSRDHHHALVIAQRLRRATAETAPETARAFLDHWNAEEQLHFRTEEEILLPAYAAHGEPDHPAIIRMLLDHVLIRRDAALLAGTRSQEEHALRRLVLRHARRRAGLARVNRPGVGEPIPGTALGAITKP